MPKLELKISSILAKGKNWVARKMEQAGIPLDNYSYKMAGEKIVVESDFGLSELSKDLLKTLNHEFLYSASSELEDEEKKEIWNLIEKGLVEGTPLMFPDETLFRITEKGRQALS